MKFAMGTICVGIGAILGLVAGYIATYVVGSIIGMAVFYGVLPIYGASVALGGYLGFRALSFASFDDSKPLTSDPQTGHRDSADAVAASIIDQPRELTDSRPVVESRSPRRLTKGDVAAALVGLCLLARVVGLVTPTWLYLPKVESRLTATADLDLSQVRIRRDSHCWVFHPWDRWESGRACYGGPAETSEEFMVNQNGSYVLPRRFFAHLNFFGHPHYKSSVTFSGREGASNTLRVDCGRNCPRYSPAVDRVRAIGLSGGPVALRFIARHGEQTIELQRLREWYPDADDVQLTSSLYVTVATDSAHRRGLHRYELDEGQPRVPDTLLFFDDQGGDFDYELSAKASVSLSTPFGVSRPDPAFRFEGSNAKSLTVRIDSRVPFPQQFQVPLIVEVDLSSYPRKPDADVALPARR